MPFAVGLSKDPDPGRAVGEVVGHILDQLGSTPDVAVLFVSGDHIERLNDIVAVVTDALKPDALIGSTASGLVGGAQEIEKGAAISLWAGRMNGQVIARHLSTHDLNAPSNTPGTGTPDNTPGTSTPDNTPGTGTPGTSDLSGFDPGDAHTLLLLADPHSFSLEAALSYWGKHHPDLKVIGGLASAGNMRDRVIVNGPVRTDSISAGPVHADGAAALLVSGDTEVVPLVSQGCKAVGQPFVITASDRNRIIELAGRPPAVRISTIVETLNEHDTELLRGGLLIGRVIDEHRAEFGRGDFLIRNIVGMDRQSGTIAITDEAPVGATVQFHVRDASTAHEDLLTLLSQAGPAQGALLFTCNGRGTHLFDEPNHDASTLAAVTDDNAVAGMFCAGEVGPIGNKSAVHGFTASAAMFRDTATVGDNARHRR